jgi:hypothetical protein
MLSDVPFWGAGLADCPTAAPDAQASQSKVAKQSHRAILPRRMLVCLDNVFAPSLRGSDRSVAVLRGN